VSYIKSEYRDGGNVGVATFYFKDTKYVQVRVADKSDVEKIEKMLDYCTKLGAEQAKETT